MAKPPETSFLRLGSGQRNNNQYSMSASYIQNHLQTIFKEIESIEIHSQID